MMLASASDYAKVYGQTNVLFIGGYHGEIAKVYDRMSHSLYIDYDKS